MTNEYMLTTLDNPFSPFTHYEEWYVFDVSHGYNTCAYLARIALSSNALSPTDEAIAIDNAMNEIVDFNLSGLHIKVTSDYVPNVVEQGE